jgi:hypothetical protein
MNTQIWNKKEGHWAVNMGGINICFNVKKGFTWRE